MAVNNVVSVGGGRGFIVEGRRDGRLPIRYIITAAHCLPHWFPAAAIIGSEERTYFDLVGSLDGALTVAAECVFADPVSDIAVLVAPDNQEFYEEALAFDEIAESAEPLTVARHPSEFRARILSRNNEWFWCGAKAFRSLWLYGALEGIRAGMSGSPILNEEGQAVGIVTSSTGRGGDGVDTEGGPMPSLMNNLPGWLLQECGH